MKMKKLVCKIIGHKYYIYAKPIEPWGEGIRWLKCRRCGSDFVINDVLRVFLPMDFELKDIYTWERADER